MREIASEQLDVAALVARPCPWCRGPTDVHTPHIRISGSAIAMYCSAECLTAGTTEIEIIEIDDSASIAIPRRRGSFVRMVHGIAVVVVAGVAVGNLSVWPARDRAGASLSELGTRALARRPPAAIDPPAIYGPSWPPADDEWMVVLAEDVWVHPLPGPVRRMPQRASRVFGAERDGDRPPECLSGHCGVDVGGEVWGEAVLAVHDGVVERVERNPDHPRGGMYVRIGHRGGTIATQYFHLAAIPRRIAPGVEVDAGELIGLVGETGVDDSGPHLHFSLSVRPEGARLERYIDPEPLLAIWPLASRIPGGATFVVDTDSGPGVPRGPSLRR